MIERGIKPIDCKLNGVYWYFSFNKFRKIKITSIDVRDAQQTFVVATSECNEYTIKVSPTRENNWGYNGLIPIFGEKNDCVQYEIDKLIEQLER